MATRRQHIAIGPIGPRASWKWLGPHLADSLADSYTVRFFREGGLPPCDVAIFIKERPEKPLRQALDRACRIAYMPVDFYGSQAQIDADAPFLGRCAGLLVHSRALGAFLARHNSAIHYVDHPNLYGLAEKPPFKPDGHLLWVGDFLNLPYLLRWWEQVRLPYKLKILTNARRTSVGGVAMTLALARRLGVGLDIRPDHVNGVPMFEWDSARQQEMMAAARAAVDIKGGEEDFRQFTKPSTKAQQFIVSGIPFAINTSSTVARELMESGFEVADVEDHEHWFSRAYWESTRAFSVKLEERIKPEAVALEYRRCLEELAGLKPGSPVQSAVRNAAVPPAAGKHAEPGRQGFPARWYGYTRAFLLHRRLGASWQDTAPHFVKCILEIYRSCMPGYMSCAGSGSTAMQKPVAVSVLVDNLSELPGEIPGTWEVITFQDLRGTSAGFRFKSIRRWPRRGLLRDRMLASAHADGEYLAFVPKLGEGEIAWIEKGAAALQSRPQTAMIRRDRSVDDDLDAAATFLVRRDVWRALKGYPPAPLILSPRCGDFDLQQRVRQLGYRVELASADELQDFRFAESRLPPEEGIVIYTAITDCYDHLQPLEKQCAKPATQVAFLDEASRAAAISAGPWSIRDIDQDEQDPNRQAKIHKIRPELFFPDARYSLWIDGNVSLVYPFGIQRLIGLYLAEADLCIFRHHARSCIYQEAEACKERRLDSSRLIDRQMTRYRLEGFPEQYGLNEAVVILRRHSEAVRGFNQQWWHEISQGSRRDQLSFNYVQWKTGLAIAEFPLSILDNNGLFTKVPHVRKRSQGKPVRTALRAMINRMEAFH